MPHFVSPNWSDESGLQHQAFTGRPDKRILGTLNYVNNQSVYTSPEFLKAFQGCYRGQEVEAAVFSGGKTYISTIIYAEPTAKAITSITFRNAPTSTAPALTTLNPTVTAATSVIGNSNLLVFTTPTIKDQKSIIGTEKEKTNVYRITIHGRNVVAGNVGSSTLKLITLYTPINDWPGGSNEAKSLEKSITANPFALGTTVKKVFTINAVAGTTVSVRINFSRDDTSQWVFDATVEAL